MQFLNPTIYTRAKSTSSVANSPSLPVISPHVLTSDPVRDYTVFNFYDEGYTKNSLLLDLVTMRAEAVQRAPIVLYDVTKPDVPIPYDEKIPLYNLLYNAHPDMGLETLLNMTETWRILGGESYLYVKREKSIITKLLPYNTAYLEAVANVDNAIDHWLFDNGQNNKIPIPKSEVIRFTWHTADPKKPWKCPSPLMACGLEIDCDYLRASLTYNLLKYGISPSYVITLGDNHEIDPNNVSRLAEQIQLRFSGKNQSRAAILHNGDKIEKLENDIGSFDGTRLSTIPETRLADVLRIPIQMTSLKSAEGSKTYTNYQEAAKYFYKNIERTWDYYGRVLTNFFKNETFPGDKRKYIIKFDVSNIEELHDSVDLQQDRLLEKYKSDGMTLDEYRLGVGMPPYWDKTKGQMLWSELQATAKAASASPLNPTPLA